MLLEGNLELIGIGKLPPHTQTRAHTHKKTRARTYTQKHTLSNTHTQDRSHAVYVSTVSKGDPLPRAKRIAWLKTSDYEGCNLPNGGFRKKNREIDLNLGGHNGQPKQILV